MCIFGYGQKKEIVKGMQYCMRFFIPILIIVAFANAQNATDFDNCNFSKVADELELVFGKVAKEYRNDSVFLEKLEAAQKAWRIYRDAHLESFFPVGSKAHKKEEYGSIYPKCACVVLVEMTKERIRQLQVWLEGTVEGDACSGSIKIKD